MTMQHIESKDGLVSFLDDPDKAKADLARTLVISAEAWRKAYGDIPLPDQHIDKPKVLGYIPEEIAYQPDQIVPGTTRAYMGSLLHHDDKGEIIPIFNRLQGIEIYTSPERKIRRQSLEIDGRLAGKLADGMVREFNQAGINVSDFAKDILREVKFSRNPKVVELVWLTSYDLGFTGVTTTRDIFKRGDILGLERCEAEVGPYQIFADKDQPMNTWYVIAMNPIADRGGGPGVFLLERGGDGLWLDGSWADPGYRWNPGGSIVFCLRKSTQNPGLLDRFFKH